MGGLANSPKAYENHAQRSREGTPASPGPRWCLDAVVAQMCSLNTQGLPVTHPTRPKAHPQDDKRKPPIQQAGHSPALSQEGLGLTAVGAQVPPSARGGSPDADCIHASQARRFCHQSSPPPRQQPGGATRPCHGCPGASAIYLSFSHPIFRKDFL